MSLAHVHSRALAGINAPAVTVEVHLSNGLPSLSIVGLPETAVKESKDRVRSAIINSGFEFPKRRLTINLAPADLPKDGGRFDLPIALGILAASSQIDKDVLNDYEFFGELSLSGTLQPVTGILPSVIQASKQERRCIIPQQNSTEASLAKEAPVYPANHLLSITQHLATGNTLHALDFEDEAGLTSASYTTDLTEVKGQQQAKRALEIAAAGQHSLIFIGPPGTGKSMLAERLPGILPAMTEEEALETVAVLSLASNTTITASQFYQRPYRAPHHTASSAALVGGGSNPRPGEISLAHNGVLFLDELPEFDRKVLDSLREPLESGKIIISRAARQAEFPANVQLIGAMNPCPCGYLGDTRHACSDTPDQIQRYRARLTGPFLDRVDLFINVPRIAARELNNQQAGESSETVRERVRAARQQQLDRAGTVNARLKPAQMKSDCQLANDDEALLIGAMERLGLSTRAHDRILRVARTIADLDGAENIETAHLTEAINYRRYTRQFDH